MELSHCHSSFTKALACLNDGTIKLSTSLPNIEHDLGISNNDIDNRMSLSNTLFLEEEELSTHVHKDINDSNLDPYK